jgi:hypothetical protein
MSAAKTASNLTADFVATFDAIADFDANSVAIAQKRQFDAIERLASNFSGDSRFHVKL